MIITTIVLSTIAAFAWRDYVQEVFNRYFRGNDELRARLWYAVIATVSLVVIVYLLGRYAEWRDPKKTSSA